MQSDKPKTNSSGKRSVYLEVIEANDIEGQVLKNRFMVSVPLD